MDSASESPEERRARRAAAPVVVYSSPEEMEEAELEMYRQMTGEERVRLVTQLVNPRFVSSRERTLP